MTVYNIDPFKMDLAAYFNTAPHTNGDLRDYFHQTMAHTLSLALYFSATVLNIDHYSVEADHYNLSEIEVRCLHPNIFDILWALYFGEVSRRGMLQRLLKVQLFCRR